MPPVAIHLDSPLRSNNHTHIYTHKPPQPCFLDDDATDIHRFPYPQHNAATNAESPSLTVTDSSGGDSPCPDLDDAISASPSTSTTSSQANSPETQQSERFEAAVGVAGLHLILPEPTQDEAVKEANGDGVVPTQRPLEYMPQTRLTGAIKGHKKTRSTYLEPGMRYSHSHSHSVHPLGQQMSHRSRSTTLQTQTTYAEFRATNTQSFTHNNTLDTVLGTFKPLPTIPSPDLSNPPNFSQNTDSFTDRPLDSEGSLLPTHELPNTPLRVTRRHVRNAQSLSSAALNIVREFPLSALSPPKLTQPLGWGESPARSTRGRGLLDEMPCLTEQGWRETREVEMEKADVVRSVVEWAKGLKERMEEL